VGALFLPAKIGFLLSLRERTLLARGPTPYWVWGDTAADQTSSVKRR